MQPVADGLSIGLRDAAVDVVEAGRQQPFARSTLSQFYAVFVVTALRK